MSCRVTRSVQHLAHVSETNNPELFPFEHHVKFIPIYLVLLHWMVSVFSYWTSTWIHRDQLPLVENTRVNSLFLNIEILIGKNSFSLNWSTRIIYLSTSNKVNRDESRFIESIAQDSRSFNVERNGSCSILFRLADLREVCLIQDQVKFITIDSVSSNSSFTIVSSSISSWDSSELIYFRSIEHQEFSESRGLVWFIAIDLLAFNCFTWIFFA